MSGATSHIHLSVTVKLADLESQVDEYAKAISKFRQTIDQTFVKAKKDVDDDCILQTADGKPCDNAWRMQLDKDHLRYLRMSETFASDAGHLKSRVRNLRGVVPTPPGAADESLSDEPPVPRERRGITSQLIRHGGSSVLKKMTGWLFKGAKNGMLRQARSPSLIFSLAKGILGTFMGFYTQKQIDKLRDTVDTLRQEHDQLVEVVTENRVAIVRLEGWMTKLNQTITVLNKLNPGIVVAEMSSMFIRLEASLEIAIHTVQRAMHRRLAVDLSPSNLEKIFDNLTAAASLQGFQTYHHPDLRPFADRDLVRVRWVLFYFTPPRSNDTERFPTKTI